MAGVLVIVAGFIGAGPTPRPPGLPTQAALVLKPTTTTVDPNAPTTTTTVAPAGGTPVTTATPGVPVPVAAHVTALGDSVMLGAAQALQDTIGADRVLVDAEESRQFPAGVDKLQFYRDSGQLGDEVVVQLGTNGTVNPEDFDRMMEVLKGVKKVVVLNTRVPRPWEDQVNQVLADGVKRYKNQAVLVDWHTIAGEHPEFFWDDGFHLRPEGAQYYAQLIAGYLVGARVRSPRLARPGAGAPTRADVGRGCSVCQAGKPKCSSCARSEPWSSASSSAASPSARAWPRSCRAAPRSSPAHHYTVKTVTKLRDLSQKSTVYWSDGVTKMDELGLQDRQNVTYAELAGSVGGQRVINAVISTEDQSFWTNDGIDLGAVFRAFITNVTSGGIEQGGSTITQQLVKNRILSPARDVNRKVKEIEDALRLNEQFSKKKILEEYLNTVYFGQNSYGIKSAASRFFITAGSRCDPAARARRLDELTIGEAALLAGVIANPEGTNPFSYPSRAIKRRGDVLQSEVESGIHHAGRSRRREQRTTPDLATAGPAPAEQPPRVRGPGPPPQRPAARQHSEEAARHVCSRVVSRSRPRSTRTCSRSPTTRCGTRCRGARPGPTGARRSSPSIRPRARSRR